jgi:hypothetical protein
LATRLLPSARLGDRAYDRRMLWILLIVVLGVVAYRFRVKLLARILGQPERRIERQLGRRKNH